MKIRNQIIRVNYHINLKNFFRLSLILLLFSGCGERQETTKPATEDISESVYASGVVKSKDQHQVFPLVSGIVEQIMVSEGDLVERGDPLIKLTDEAARLSTENARMAAENALISANAARLDELLAAIDLARSIKDHDSLLLVRQQNLWDKKIGTKVELEKRELSYKNALISWRSALLRYKDFKKQLLFASGQAQKNLEISQLRTADYTVKSETSGKVYGILKERGDMVNPQIPVALVGAAEDFILELQVDEYDIARIKKGQRVLLHMDSYKGKVFEGRIEKINPAMNERTRSFVVEAGFVVSPPVLYPNITAEANIIIRQKENALTIPRAYLLDGSYVLLEKGKDKVKVKTGLMDYQKAEILEGLTKEDVIVKPEI